MSTGLPKRTRRDRVAGLELMPSAWDRATEALRRSDVQLRLGLCLLAAVAMLILTRAWSPPLIYREGQTRRRGIVSTVEFRTAPRQAKEEAEGKARRQARQVYKINDAPLVQQRARFASQLALLTDAKSYDAKAAKVWQEFLPADSDSAQSATPADKLAKAERSRRQFENFRAALSVEWRPKFDEAVKKSLAEFEERGLLEKLADTQQEQNQAEIIVYPEKDWAARKPVAVKEVRIADAKPKLLINLRRELKPLEMEVIEQSRRKARQVYALNPEPIVKLRARLMEAINKLAEAKGFDENTAKLWQDFVAKPGEGQPKLKSVEQKLLFEKFREAMSTEKSRTELAAAIGKVLADYEKNGLLVQLKGPDEAPETNPDEIIVYPMGKESARETVKVASVRLGELKPKLRESLERQLSSLEVAARVFLYLERELPTATTLEYQPPKKGEGPLAVEPALAEHSYYWLERLLPTTLEYDADRTTEVRETAARDVKPEEYEKKYKVGMPLVEAGQTISQNEMELLRSEHAAVLSQLTAGPMILRVLAVLGMYLALYTLCGFFLYYRYPDVLSDLTRFGGLLCLVVLTVSCSYWLNSPSAELVMLLMFGMIVTIVHHQELALLLLAAVGLVVVLAVGQGLPTFVMLMASGAAAILLLRRVRARTKLIYVGGAAGLVAMLTTLGVAIVDGQSPDLPLLRSAGLSFVYGVVAGSAMLCLLPFIERVFGVMTDISLLELGDVAHPLLQELVRRAPGTYNHSINVASLAEAAAERVGAHGLLVRVGAYFHDIGKILKPEYFAENQHEGENRHEALVPAMSTLIIVAHVKDGADLARERHLPRPIIDFIQQHHGTTLVEYFYHRANEQSSEEPDAPEVDENAFRYPGPKPQTKESGVLMLADAVESASRVLVEPTPARIESLVREITMKRLLDGQFDESGLTLKEVQYIEESLVKSLTAVYHGRVKYPDQMTA